jgi:hypothetical protein
VYLYIANKFYYKKKKEIPRIFIEPEGSSPYLQVLTICPYPEPTPSSSHNPLQLPEDPRLGLSNSLFPSGFPTNTLCTRLSSPIRATCPAHLIILDFTTSTILGKEYNHSAPHYVTISIPLSPPPS